MPSGPVAAKNPVIARSSSRSCAASTARATGPGWNRASSAGVQPRNAVAIARRSGVRGRRSRAPGASRRSARTVFSTGTASSVERTMASWSPRPPVDSLTRTPTAA